MTRAVAGDLHGGPTRLAVTAGGVTEIATGGEGGTLDAETGDTLGAITGPVAAGAPVGGTSGHDSILLSRVGKCLGCFVLGLRTILHDSPRSTCRVFLRSREGNQSCTWYCCTRT